MLLSCKKSAPSTPTQPAYTRLDTITTTISVSAIVGKNSKGQWIVTLSSSMNPFYDSLTVLGTLTYNVYDGGTFKYSQLDQNSILGSNTVDILTGTLASPNVQSVQYAMQSWHSFGTIDYIPNFQYQQ
jgi:hypothetical protein